MTERDSVTAPLGSCQRMDNLLEAVVVVSEVTRRLSSRAYPLSHVLSSSLFPMYNEMGEIILCIISIKVG